MTSPRDAGAHPPTGFIGHLRVRPELNAAERGHLRALGDVGGTLRGTPTGRGDRDVPFARLEWEVCAGGCCLTWNPGLEESRMMLPTLRFVIDHLLRDGARAKGRAGFEGFTFDHVVDGAVMGGDPWERELRLVEVVGNAVTERLLQRGCAVGTPVRTAGSTRRGTLPANVIELRPWRA